MTASTEKIKKILALLGLLAIAGCGGNPVGENAPSIDVARGMLAIKVIGASSFNPHIDHGRIEKFKVKVEGLGMQTPIEVEVQGDATEAIVEGVPAGGERVVSVEAANRNGATIRAGETGGVEVGGGMTDVDVRLEAVPIFTNIKENGVVENTRLVLRIFSDPQNEVTVGDVEDGVQNMLINADTNLPEIRLDQSTGLGKMAPRILRPGLHRFTVRDTKTGRSSSVNARLIDGTLGKPAPLNAAGSVMRTTATGFGDIVQLSQN